MEKMLKELLTSKKAWSSDRCKMIWKKRVSKSNVLLFQLQASVRGIKGNEFGLLHTPTATEIGMRSEAAMEKRKKYRESIGRKTTPPGNLLEQIQMYPTPTSVQRPNEGNMRLMRKQVLQGQISREEASAMVGKDVFKAHGKVKMYPTPTAGCEEGGEQSNRVEQTKSGGFVLRKKNKPNMTFGAKLSDAMLYMEKMYPTPTSRDWKDMSYNPITNNNDRKLLPIVALKNNVHGGKLNPHFVEFLMGYPMNWTKVEPTE